MGDPLEVPRRTFLRKHRNDFFCVCCGVLTRQIFGTEEMTLVLIALSCVRSLKVIVYNVVRVCVMTGAAIGL